MATSSPQTIPATNTIGSVKDVTNFNGSLATANIVPTDTGFRYTNHKGEIIDVDLTAHFATREDLQTFLNNAVARPVTQQELETGTAPSNAYVTLAQAKSVGVGQVSDGLIGRFDLHTDAYDVMSHVLTVSVATYVQPKLLLEDTGAASAWVAATQVAGSTRRWTATFNGVLKSGRIRIKAADDDLGVGHSMSLFIPNITIPPLIAAEN